MTDAYFVHDDNYKAMKEDRDRHNGQKKIIREFNGYLEQKLAEDEELAAILSTFAAPTSNKTLIVPKQLGDSD